MSKILNFEELENFETEKKTSRCRLCPNNCQLTIHNFDKRRYITGNRCDKPLRQNKKTDALNLVSYKYDRLFDYAPLNDEEAINGQVGLPRGLNMYEHYPFWFTFFTTLKYQVIISDTSSKQLYEKGMDTIPSESLCYPAKLMNGHVKNLIDKNIKFIFYPSVMHEKKDGETDNRFSCPVVTSYSEVIKSNMDEIAEKKVKYMNPFITIYSLESAKENLVDLATELNVTKEEIIRATELAWEELEKFQQDIREKAVETIKTIKEKKIQTIVLAGRPYHIDPEINHGLDKVITSYGLSVITEDMVSFLEEDLNLRVVNQWIYHSRLYKAATYVGKNKEFDLIQLNSFGCGIDSITVEQVKEIIEHHNKVYTCLKIDEGENLGAAKIRIRSLVAAVDERVANNVKTNKEKYNYEPVKLTKPLKEYKILAPQMSPIHFQFLETAIKSQGYDVYVLPEVDKNDISCGLKYVNNDSCYPALVVIGQMIKALELYDLEKEDVALLISQTGGGCRASNYISLLRRGLAEAGYENVPVISFNSGNIEDENSMNITPQMVKRLLLGVTYGDLLLRITNKSRAYEINKGETDRVLEEVIPLIQKNVEDGSYLKFRKNIKKIVKKFDIIELSNEVKPKVGIVGEILVKYHPSANNQLVKVIEENGGEAVIPELVDFFLYTLVNAQFRYENLYKSKKKLAFTKVAIKAIETYRRPIKKALVKSKNFESFHSIDHTQKNAQKMLSLGNQTGEGWFLTGEMVNLIEDGVNNIICTQPFGCLPNHITGKGMFKKVRENYEDANIVAIDYDPGASEVNQINRIKLMMTVAKRNLD